MRYHFTVPLSRAFTFNHRHFLHRVGHRRLEEGPRRKLPDQGEKTLLLLAQQRKNSQHRYRIYSPMYHVFHPRDWGQ